MSDVYILSYRHRHDPFESDYIIEDQDGDRCAAVDSEEAAIEWAERYKFSLYDRKGNVLYRPLEDS